MRPLLLCYPKNNSFCCPSVKIGLYIYYSLQSYLIYNHITFNFYIYSLHQVFVSSLATISYI
jgi:hypothetical protein